jgi:hypothetical protein
LKTTLHTGNALDVLRTLPDNSCDSLVTDPPAGIAFMGRAWDTDKGGRKQWVAWLTEILVEVHRVLKPGAHGLLWALPRTAHWTGLALEDAGFEIRDNIVNHINGQGFPKSTNVSKMLDRKEQDYWINIGKEIDNLEQDVILRGWKERSKIASAAGLSFQSELLEAGPHTLSCDSVHAPVLLTAKTESSAAVVILAELRLNAALRTSATQAHSVLMHVGESEKPDPAKYAENQRQKHQAKPLPTGIAQCNVRDWQNESTVDKRKAVEALKTWLGKKKSSKQGGFDVLCAALTDDLKATILSRSETFRSFDTTQQMECASVISVTITEFTAASLISFMVDTLRREALDKAAGAEREVVGEYVMPSDSSAPGARPSQGLGYESSKTVVGRPLTAPATPEAAQWEGWGSALKPSQEIWWLVRKPLSEKTVAANVLKWGTGALNIDATRITSDGSHFRSTVVGRSGGMVHGADNRSPSAAGMFAPEKAFEPTNHPGGRWPSNVLFSHIEGNPCPNCTGEDSSCPTCQGTGEVGGCRKIGTKRVRGTSVPASNPTVAVRKSGVHSEAKGHQTIGREQPVTGHADPDGKETVEAWECVPGCPVDQLNEQSGITTSGAMKRKVRAYEGNSITGFLRGDSGPHNQHGDSGGASRFFYCPKASTRERYLYCRTCNDVYPRKEIKAHADHDIFQHPTQKSLALMEYLVRLVTPPGGIVLDPFCGTGTTGVAAHKDFAFIGIDLDPDAIRVATYRTANDTESPPTPPHAEPQHHPKKTMTLFSLFGRQETIGLKK